MPHFPPSPPAEVHSVTVGITAPYKDPSAAMPDHLPSGQDYAAIVVKSWHLWIQKIQNPFLERLLSWWAIQLISTVRLLGEAAPATTDLSTLDQQQLAVIAQTSGTESDATMRSVLISMAEIPPLNACLTVSVSACISAIGLRRAWKARQQSFRQQQQHDAEWRQQQHLR